VMKIKNSGPSQKEPLFDFDFKRLPLAGFSHRGNRVHFQARLSLFQFFIRQ
jgi:hypothetical protein